MKDQRLALTALTTAVAAALCTLSFGARADDTNRPLTREEVVAQVLAARQSGELAVLQTGGTWTPQQPAATVSREQVAADVMAARQSGELAVLETGGTWSRDSSAAPAPVSREQVIAEFLKTRQVSDALAMEQSL